MPAPRAAGFEDLLSLCIVVLIDNLSCTGLPPFRTLCRTVRDSVDSIGPLHAAAAFAASRVRLPRLFLRSDGEPCWQRRGLEDEVYEDSSQERGTLTMWMYAWEECARVVEAKGREASVWAHSRLRLDRVLNFMDQIDSFLVEEWRESVGILAMRCPTQEEFLGLLLLNDGSYALCQVLKGRRSVDMFIHIAEKIAELAPFWGISDEGLFHASMEGAEQYTIPLDESCLVCSEPPAHLLHSDRVARLLMASRHRIPSLPGPCTGQFFDQDRLLSGSSCDARLSCSSCDARLSARR